tara:strand:- start:260 stop:430 length:171 start_codon:yes stop_codon:yes gene_type:complete
MKKVIDFGGVFCIFVVKKERSGGRKREPAEISFQGCGDIKFGASREHAQSGDSRVT